jgi:hypothetical protein
MMNRILLKFSCPHCKGAIELRPECEDGTEGFAVSMGHHQCPACGTELFLYADKIGPQTIHFRLVEPKTDWTVDDILAREG